MDHQINLKKFPIAESERHEPSGGDHTITLISRKRLEITGVKDVLRFDDVSAELETVMGILLVDGEGLRIDVFDTSKGNVTLCGFFRTLDYYENKPEKADKRSGLFGKR